MANATSPVLSITGRVCSPGFILVEGGSSSEVYSLVTGMDYLFATRASIMPPEMVIEYFRRSKIWTPHSPGWVRLTSFPYNGDLAYVYDVDARTLMATVLTVPRMDYTPLEDRSHVPRERPEKAFFNAPAVRACFGQDTVGKRNDVFLFENETYIHGLLQSDTNKFVCQDAEPTDEELYWFYQCPMVPQRWMYATFDRLRKNELEHGNKVKIITGDRTGSMAVILEIEDDAANVILSKTHEKLTLDIAQIRKYVSIGDKVKVTAGPHAQFTGWVVAIANNEVQVYNHDTCEEVTY